MNRQETLDAASVCVMRDRNTNYGDPERNFEDIAELWSTYKEVKFDPHDVAVMCMLIKVARIKQSPEKEDHWIDMAGYAACGAECATNESNKKA